MAVGCVRKLILASSGCGEPARILGSVIAAAVSLYQTTDIALTHKVLT